jgi:hypothetical protein
VDIERFCNFRPFLYHLTFAESVPIIERDGVLRPAASFLSGVVAGQRRTAHIQTLIGGRVVKIRDQKPFAEGAISFEDGWNPELFIRLLNAHVFFWPGTAAGPQKPGRAHLDRYREECPKVLRLNSTDILLDADRTPAKFSRYNSGAPRCSGGKRSPRGENTFLSASDFTGGMKQVVEVAVPSDVRLPSKIHWLSIEDLR